MIIKHAVTVIFLTAAFAVLDVQALDCTQARNTIEINECAAIEKDKVEVELNKTYRQVLAHLDQSDDLVRDDAKRAKAKLIEAQRAWVRFREADCKALYNLHASGSIRTVIWIDCMQSHAEQRIKALNYFLEAI